MGFFAAIAEEPKISERGGATDHRRFELDFEGRPARNRVYMDEDLQIWIDDDGIRSCCFRVDRQVAMSTRQLGTPLSIPNPSQVTSYDAANCIAGAELAGLATLII